MSAPDKPILFSLSADLAEQEAIEKIDEVQNEIDRLNEQASEEILKVGVYYKYFLLPSISAISRNKNYWELYTLFFIDERHYLVSIFCDLKFGYYFLYLVIV